jgi:hypothetical protein
VTININYFGPLLEDEADSVTQNDIRFTFPRMYCSRSGSAPTGQIRGESLEMSRRVPFHMTVNVLQKSKILQLVSLSGHRSQVKIGRLADESQNQGHNPMHGGVIIDHRPADCDEDVVITIGRQRFETPIAFLEHHPTAGSSVVAVNLYTRFEGEKMPELEYIALVDRSTSMDGIKLLQTKGALEYVLSQLPEAGTFFNIFSYGSKCDSLWTNSREYNQINYSTALDHIKFVIHLSAVVFLR